MGAATVSEILGLLPQLGGPARGDACRVGMGEEDAVGTGQEDLEPAELLFRCHGGFQVQSALIPPAVHGVQAKRVLL